MIAIITVVPAGKEALSKAVSEVVDVIDTSGISYQLTSMGTILEGEPDEVWAVVRQCHEKMRASNHRVLTHISIDDREDAVESIRTKVDDIENHLARKLKT